MTEREGEAARARAWARVLDELKDACGPVGDWRRAGLKFIVRAEAAGWTDETDAFLAGFAMAAGSRSPVDGGAK